MQATCPALWRAELEHSVQRRRPHERQPRAPGSVSSARLQSTHRSVRGLEGSAGGWANNGFGDRAIVSHSASASAMSIGSRPEEAARSVERGVGNRASRGDRGVRETTGGGGRAAGPAGDPIDFMSAGRSVCLGGPSHHGGSSVRGLGWDVAVTAGVGLGGTAGVGRLGGGLAGRVRSPTSGGGSVFRLGAGVGVFSSSGGSPKKREKTPAPRITAPAATTSSQMARCPPGTAGSSSDRTTAYPTRKIPSANRGAAPLKLRRASCRTGYASLSVISPLNSVHRERVEGGAARLPACSAGKTSGSEDSEAHIQAADML